MTVSASEKQKIVSRVTAAMLTTFITNLVDLNDDPELYVIVKVLSAALVSAGLCCPDTYSSDELVTQLKIDFNKQGPIWKAIMAG